MANRSTRQLVADRARGCCEYCRSQARFATECFAVEHIEPRSKQGEDQPENLALACLGCSGHKYNHTAGVDPVTGQRVPLFHPRRQRWRDHFTWSEDFSLIVGLTGIGRATVEALHLNRPSLVNLRRVLFGAGEHPPVDEG